MVRAARTMRSPPGELVVEIRDPEKPKGKPLARASVHPGRLSRQFKRSTAALRASLEKGKKYELVYSSPKSSSKASWLVNCFYCDAYPAGEHFELRSSGRKKLGDFDMVFTLTSGAKGITSVPKGMNLDKSEHFGLGHDGTDLRPAKARH
jgi:hypothetical protein